MKKRTPLTQSGLMAIESGGVHFDDAPFFGAVVVVWFSWMHLVCKHKRMTE